MSQCKEEECGRPVFKDGLCNPHYRLYKFLARSHEETPRLKKPADIDVDRAVEYARERGWLTDEGWVWD